MLTLPKLTSEEECVREVNWYNNSCEYEFSLIHGVCYVMKSVNHWDAITQHQKTLAPR